MVAEQETKSMSEGLTFQHDAFVSYSRRDKKFACSLERALEKYLPPKDLPLPRRHLDIFRDEQDFTGTAYYRSVEKHLNGSRKLIVICSPSARASDFVNEEVDVFAQSRGVENIVPLLLCCLECRPAKLNYGRLAPSWRNF